MKDRQPTQVLANGAIRYGIYNADGTLARYEYMKREDAPTVEGTPLNKANLLSDETEAKIWRGDDKPEEPTVNDALNKLADGTAKIGDIEITARTDLSASWLPCDGRTVSQEQYPDLFAILRSSAAPLPWQAKPTAIQFSYLAYLNNEWIGVSGTSIYTSSDAENWTQKSTLPSGLSVDCMQYSNGVYYAVLYGDENAGVYTTQDIATPFTLYASDGFSSSRGIKMYFASDNVYLCREMQTYGSYLEYTGAETKCYYINKNTNKIVEIPDSIDGFVWFDNAQNLFYRLQISNGLKTSKSRTLINPTWEVVSSVSLSSLSPSFNAPSSYTYDRITSVYNSGQIVIAFCIIASYDFTGINYTRYKGWGVYRYSIDNGLTWHNGKVVSYSIATSVGTYPDTYNGGVYNNGFFVLPSTVTELLEDANKDSARVRKVIAISDPAVGQSYSSVLGNYAESIALSPDAKSAYISSDGIAYCDYGNVEKAIPAISIDTRSKAYIKALEE